jgi:hypothetical protein
VVESNLYPALFFFLLILDYPGHASVTDGGGINKYMLCRIVSFFVPWLSTAKQKSRYPSEHHTTHMQMHATSREEAPHIVLKPPRCPASLTRYAMPWLLSGPAVYTLSLHRHWRMPSRLFACRCCRSFCLLLVVFFSFLFGSCRHVRRAPWCAPSVGLLAGSQAGWLAGCRHSSTRSARGASVRDALVWRDEDYRVAWGVLD